MDFLRLVLLFVHLIGFAALFGGAFTQMKGPKRVVNPAMWHGSLTMLVSGLALVAVREIADLDVNHVKIAVKLVLMLVVFALVVAQRKKDDIAPGIFFATLGLTAVNAAVAVFI